MSFCNGCTACCHGDNIHLLPGDGVYDTVERGGKQWLRQVNGQCVYLKDNGCSIYQNQPRMCRMFNCVTYFKLMDRARRRRLVKADKRFGPIFEAARARMTDERSPD